jgi:hypothetical protein
MSLTALPASRLAAPLAAAFFAISAPAQGQLTQGQGGHAPVMPYYGASLDKICRTAGPWQKPGNWYVTSPKTAAAQIVSVMGNDCKPRPMRINPTTRELLDIVDSSEEPGAPVLTPPPGSQPAPERWWEQAGLLAPSSTGVPSVSGPFTGQLCRVRFGSNLEFTARAGSIIIPDATLAFYLTIRNNPAIMREQTPSGLIDYSPFGKSECALVQFITLPQPTITIASGYRGLPGPITTPPDPRAHTRRYFGMRLLPR